MPSSRYLRENGRRDLDNAITNMGGYRKVAGLLGWSNSSARRPNGYWKDFATLKKELLLFTKENSSEITPGLMPTQKQLRDLGRSDIVKAIEIHGGTTAVAEELGLSQRVVRKRKHYWKDWSKVEDALCTFVAERAAKDHLDSKTVGRSTKSRPSRMPSQRELRKAGRTDLAEAISDFHGGFREVAKKLGFVSKKKDDFFYNSFYNVAHEVYALSINVGQESVMPSTSVLKLEGRTDLAAAIVKFKGMSAVSQRLGLQYRVRTREAFKDWSFFRRSLLAFMKTHSNQTEIPSSRMLNNFGRADLYQAILHHGGSREVADRMGLKRNHWQDFHHVGLEVLRFIETHGTAGVMPSESEFLLVGRNSLNVAVSKFGHSQVAKRLGLSERMHSAQSTLDMLLASSISVPEHPGESEVYEEFF